MGSSWTARSLDRAKFLSNKKPRKINKKKLKKVRFKSDELVIRQHQIYEQIKARHPGVTKDLKKFSHWWDLALINRKIVIMFGYPNGKMNVFAGGRAKSTGWTVLVVNYIDKSGESMEKLLKSLDESIET